MPLGQSVTVINKSGVIVKNSKQLADVFKEAKAAYTAKKAELKAGREAAWDEKQARRDFENLRLDDGASRASSRRPKDRPHASRSAGNSGHNTPRRHHSDEHIPRGGNLESTRRPSHAKRGVSDQPYEFYEGGRTLAEHEQDTASRGLRRSYTDGLVRPSDTSRRRRSFEHRRSNDSIDMALAYGEMPPPLPARTLNDEAIMRGKMTKLTRLLEEAHCVQHSATATITHLQKNPDALAAVALTLAEMSKVASRMAPGALVSLGKLFPAALGLLLSPELLIAAGVGVGITVVMLGGYKIVKRIKDKKELDREMETPLQLQEIDPALSNIETWRRGIADAEALSIATSADGEFVTPMAGKRLVEEGTIKQEWLKAPEVRRKPVLPSRSRSARVSRSGESSSGQSRSRKASPTEKSSASNTVVATKKRSKSRPSGMGRTPSERSVATSTTSTKMDGAKTIVKGVKMLFQGKSVPEGERR